VQESECLAKFLLRMKVIPTIDSKSRLRPVRPRQAHRPAPATKIEVADTKVCPLEIEVIGQGETRSMLSKVLDTMTCRNPKTYRHFVLMGIQNGPLGRLGIEEVIDGLQVTTNEKPGKRLLVLIHYNLQPRRNSWKP
jgi:hypothetical protein